MSENKQSLEMQNPQENQKNEYEEVTLFKNPLIIITTSIKMLLEQLTKSIKFLLTHKIFLSLIIIITLSSLFDGPHRTVKFNLKKKIFKILFLEN